MSRKQTRRSISVRGDIYERVKRYCDNRGISMSAFIEERILEFLGGNGGAKRSSKDVQEEIAQHFTF
jgi:hypothetical protein